MAEENRPVKGILKNSTSFDHDGVKDAAQSKKEREMKWDEMNILATYHPADKDYGHNKIDEPPTPYNHMTDEDTEHSGDEQQGGDKPEEVDPQSLASRLAETEDVKRERTISSGTEEDEDETEEDRAKRKSFEQKRKMHYNEFHAVKLARQLLDDDDEEEGGDSAPSKDESTPL
eukprot:GHVO01041717.1.p1 GENE.GHVO01041717.1~~GHVO01041717.1.p1  ORF type:complete len:174 (+),score=36.05 GHVO01041717.1:23-544(+)